jgi:outer membrane protein assembly factor BamB
VNSTLRKLASCAALSLAVAAVSLSQVAQAENWPQFRGPTGQGISSEKNVPIKWSAGQNVAWKTPLAAAGWSSPIVYGDRVFVTGTTAGGSKCHVIAIDRTSGKIIWDKEVLTQETRRKESKNSYATPTPVTDGKYVFAVFGGGGIVAVDYLGNVAWTYDEVKFYSRHGLGASPVLYENLLIMPFDRPRKKSAGKSRGARRGLSPSIRPAATKSGPRGGGLHGSLIRRPWSSVRARRGFSARRAM